MMLSGSYRILSSPVFPAIAFHRSFPACAFPATVIEEEKRRRKKIVAGFFREEYGFIVLSMISLYPHKPFDRCTILRQ
jgi:hypothetical protein